MARVALTGNAYVERSVIASAQETINLIANKNMDDQAPVPFTYYPSPGTLQFALANNPGLCRCTYRTSIGTAYVVIGPTVYFLALNGALIFVGSIADNQSQVYMADNGLAVVVVDGTTAGYAIDMSTNDFGPIIDTSFYGADFALFLNTFFIFNRPATDQFYISLSNVDFSLLTTGTSFDPLDIAAKSGSSDPIVAMATVHQELVLIGALTTEIWIDTGAADFTFGQVQGAYINHGCIAPYSVANQDVVVFWVMENREGKNIIVQYAEYAIKEISTPYLVDFLNSNVSTDCIGYCFQTESEAYYVLIMPTANVTWLYSLKLEKWFKWSWYNSDDGSFNRHRSNCGMFAFGKNLVGDFENGKIYSLEPLLYTDDGGPIVRVKTFPHSIINNDRIGYNTFDADIECGTVTDDSDPQISLSWSNDRGKTYGFPVEQSMGKMGEYLTTVSWNRLGMSRDKVFKLSWSAPVKTAINGAFVELKPFRS